MGSWCHGSYCCSLTQVIKFSLEQHLSSKRKIIPAEMCAWMCYRMCCTGTCHHSTCIPPQPMSSEPALPAPRSLLSLWLHLTLPKRGDPLQFVSLAAVELSWGGWRREDNGRGCRTARVGAHRHRHTQAQSRGATTATAPHSSVPTPHPLPRANPFPFSPPVRPGRTHTGSALLQTAPAQVKTPQQQLPGSQHRAKAA